MRCKLSAQVFPRGINPTEPSFLGEKNRSSIGILPWLAVAGNGAQIRVGVNFEFRTILLTPPLLSHDIFEFPDLARKHTSLLESLTFSNICSFSFAAGGGGGGGAVAM